MVKWCFRKHGYSEVAAGNYGHSGEWVYTNLMAGQWLDSKSGATRSFGRGPRGLAATCRNLGYYVAKLLGLYCRTGGSPAPAMWEKKVDS